jgi:ATP-dependent DNA helicase RecG
MAMRRIAMCEQAGTGLRMMREAWKTLGHPSPTYKNDRAWKAFEFFIPELDKEVDMASDLVKAMFAEKSPTQSGAQSGAQSTSVMAAILVSQLSANELTQRLGMKSKTGALKRTIAELMADGFIEYTIPDKPNSRLQKYRLTEKGRKTLAGERKTRNTRDDS